MANFYTQDRRNALASLDWSLIDGPVDEYHDILEGLGEVIAEGIAPLAEENNEGAYRVENGNVVWPESVQQCYDTLKDIGGLCLTAGEEYGGLGLPGTLSVMTGEMLSQADAGWSTIPLLQSGGVEFLVNVLENNNVPDDLRGILQETIEGLVSGEYCSSMDLTEGDAGSDLGRLTTKAVIESPQSYENLAGMPPARITGTKTFITSGGSEVHLVLARDSDTFNETAGTTKGLGVYLVRRTIDGEPNGVTVTRLEEKVGIHSSPTCEVRFEDSLGYRLCPRGGGMNSMFLLMNEARLGVAAQALGMIEQAGGLARAYADERVQFGKPISRIRVVKDMLDEIDDYGKLIRAVIYETAFSADVVRSINRTGKNKDRLREFENKQNLLTPVIKYYAARRADELTSKALQVHGGMGYTMESPIQRVWRDARITSIYEGTDEIQASLFAGDALKGAMRPDKARANLGVLIQDIQTRMEESDDPLAMDVYEASRNLEHGFDSLVGYVKKSAVWEALEQAVPGSGELSDVVAAAKHPTQAVQAVKRAAGKDGRKLIDQDGLLSHGKRLAALTAEVYGLSLLVARGEDDSARRILHDVLPESYAAKQQFGSLDKAYWRRGRQERLRAEAGGDY